MRASAADTDTVQEHANLLLSSSRDIVARTGTRRRLCSRWVNVKCTVRRASAYLPAAGANEFDNILVAAAVQDGHLCLELLHGFGCQVLLTADFDGNCLALPDTLVDLRMQWLVSRPCR